MDISGNTILITGGTSGIGRALAEALHAKGNQVIVAGRRQQLLDEVTAANPGMKGLAVDMESPQAVDAFAARVKADFPKLNVLINNAGIMKMEDLTTDSIDMAPVKSTIFTNIVSVLHLTAALLPTLKAQPKATVIATTSGLAFVPLASTPTYSATKAFLHSWLQSLRHQLRDTSVEVLDLAPPYVQTELLGEHQKTDPRAMPLNEYIAEVMTLLADPNPPNGEILVERVKFLRDAEKGNHPEVFQAVNSLL